MGLILFILVYGLLPVGGIFVLASLRFFILAMIEEDSSPRISSGVKYLLWGLGLLIVWGVIVYSVFSGIHC